MRVYGAAPAAPDGLAAVRRGFTCRCPRCGGGRLFGRFLKVEHACSACGQEFHHHRADDFPPYIVMFIVGHLLGYGIYVTEMKLEGLPLAVHALLWPSLAIVLCLALLQPVKGAVVGLQYALGMHGFGRPPADAAVQSRAGDEGERRAR
ncbi:DUF983 domain-containing protein [Enterovirga sp. DB1703]|uniref:DUF983 domain-containing protein n=2 Tax=Enterovirga aerilata TaxID=2730920 RepID=A0A849I738_9HYPH|nr:DUF983 domain-containing protein [Enterovirga sp. DB1703]NNM72125.1 DUF983 domain-containing protein [Enterovirga sp. DB1703]